LRGADKQSAPLVGCAPMMFLCDHLLWVYPSRSARQWRSRYFGEEKTAIFKVIDFLSSVKSMRNFLPDNSGSQDITLRMTNPAIVIVPGAWHKPQHYHYVVDGLRTLGYEAEAVDLPSIDSNPPHSTWENDAEEIRRVIMRHLDVGRNVITVAHSFGGVAMSEAVKDLGQEKREKQGLKASVLHLVYMCAMALPKGQSYVGQMTPTTPEEEEMDKQRKELQEKHSGVQVRPVRCLFSFFLKKSIFSSDLKSLTIIP